MKVLVSFLLAVLLLSGCCALAAAEGQARKTLVLIDSDEVRETHSVYLDLIQRKAKEFGHAKVDVHVAGAEGVKLRHWDEWVYDSLVLLAPTAQELGGEKLSEAVTEFVEAGHSLVLSGSEDMSSETRALAANCGAKFSDNDLAVIDHFEYHGEDRSLLRATNFVEDRGSILRKTLSSSTSNSPTKPLLWRGVGQNIDAGNALAFSAVTAFSTSYCPTKKGFMSKKSPLRDFTGTTISLVSLVQARNNARVAITGSFASLSDEFMSNKEASNLAFGEDINAWALGYTSVLRYRDFTHSMRETGETKEIYRIKDELLVSVVVEEWSASKQAWLPYIQEEGKELQVELTMLDPHVRKTFKADKGVLKTEMTAPDVYGVFKFIVDYNCLGYSYIHFEEQVPIRPFRHDEYERFIVAAYPYYASIFSCMAAFFIFGFAVLYTK
jgi:oligosaccharyltransferase complex subunit beta